MPSRPPRPPDLEKHSVLASTRNKLSRLGSWTFGKHGLEGAALDLAHSVDPRTPQGLIGALSMLVPGKPSGRAAMAAHLGHSDFRPYGIPNPNRRAAEPMFNDPMTHGGMLNKGGDIG